MGRLMDFDVIFVLDTPEEFNPREHYLGWILPDGPIVVAHWLARHRHIAYAVAELLDIPFEYAPNDDDILAQLIGEGWVRWYSSGLKNDTIFLDGRTDDLNRPFIREAVGLLADQMGLATARIDTLNTIGDAVTDHHVLPINQYIKYGIPAYRSPMQEFRTTGHPTGTVAQPPVGPYAFTPPHEGRGLRHDPTRYYERYYQPCDPPEDPAWPTPTGYESVRALMVRLPHKQRVFCALVAAELVLPIFEEALPDNKAPRKAIAVTYRWLEGQATANEVRAASAASRTAAYAAAYAAPHAAQAAYAAADAAEVAASAFRAAETAEAAATAALVWGMAGTEFYELWWKECRCRFPFTNVYATELLTTGNVYFEQPIKRRPRP